MNKIKNQTIKVEYPNEQHLTLPGQEVENVNKEDGVLFGEWNGLMVATWGSNPENTWYTKRDFTIPKAEHKSYTDPRLRGRSIRITT
jgi:hypothetical protein